MKPTHAPRVGVACAAVAAIAIALAAPGRSAAQSADPNDTRNIDGLTVLGKGTAKAKPTFAEIELDVSASAELTGDAIVKFRDAKKRIRDAFAALKLPDVTVEEQGLLVDQKGAAFNPYMMMDMGMQSKAKVEVQLSRKLVVRAAKIQNMEEEAVLQLVGRLLDVAQDAGGRVGPPSNSAMMAYRSGTPSTSNLVRFVVEDVEKLKEEAYSRAAADAKARAERLARLNGVELGPVVGVREETPAPSPAASPSPYAILYGISEPRRDDDDDDAGERVATDKFQEVPIHVELQVRYAIRPKQAAKP